MKSYRPVLNKWKLLLPIILLLAVLLPVATVQAAEFPENPVIAKEVVIDDDVFLSGENIVVDGTIRGSLFASGATITINGTVEGDVLMGGNTIRITDQAKIGGNIFFGASSANLSGKIDGSVFGGAASMILSSGGNIARNLFYGGFGLETYPGTLINKDLFAGAYQVLLSGDVGRDINVSAAAVEINGTVGGDANLNVAEPGGQAYYGPLPPGVSQMASPGLRISDQAQIGGELVYTSPVNQAEAIQAPPSGGVVYQTPVPQEIREKPAAGTRPSRAPWVAPFLAMLKWITGRISQFAILILLGGLALWKTPALLHKTVQRVKDKPLPSAGYGFLVIVVGFIGAFLLGLAILLAGLFINLITLGGLGKIVMSLGFSSLSLLFSTFLLFVFHISKVVIAMLVGLWIVKWLAANMTPMRQNILALVIGSILYVFFRAIPLLGWFVALAAILIGTGAIWLVFQEWWKSRRQGAAALQQEAGG